MIHCPIEATIFYRHTIGEILELARAIEPMREHIRAIGSDADQRRLSAIISCQHFRAKDVARVKSMLLCAAKHARGHLSEYFPSMQDGLIGQAEALEDAAEQYATRFRALRSETVPVN